MVEVDPDPDEAARRLRSAFAYVDIAQPEAAKLLDVSLPTLQRMIGKRGKERVKPPTWSQLWRAADALGLPRAWFTADITRIHEIVPDDLPGFANDTGDPTVISPAMRSAAAAREAQELRKEALRSSVRQSAERNTKSGRRRRRDGAS